jgi:uncharacterized BrkB/YihY/UPF0761 family membrane protein
MKDQRRVGCLGLCFSVLALLYCLLGVAQAIWLSATPKFPAERAERNLFIWGSGTLLSFLLLCFFIFIFYRAGKNRIKR